MSPDRDPSVDHFQDLYPLVIQEDDVSELVVVTGTGVYQQVSLARGANVDDNGVPHFLRITADPGEPDVCGGCGTEWPCKDRVALDVVVQPPVDPELVQAVAAALREDDQGQPAR